MEYWEHKTLDRKTIVSQIDKQTHGIGGKDVEFSQYTHAFIKLLAHECTHTLLAGFSVLLAAGSGCSCLPFLDGVLLILGEWNLSISFMVKEDRWDRCESTDGDKTETVEWSVEEESERFSEIRLHYHTMPLIWYDPWVKSSTPATRKSQAFFKKRRVLENYFYIYFTVTFAFHLLYIPNDKSAGGSLFLQSIMCTNMWVHTQRRGQSRRVWLW